MDRERYISTCAYAGDWLVRPLPGPRPVDELDGVDVSTAVYIVVDALERIVYVGSVCRPGAIRGVAVRMREHLRNPLKKLTWHTVWVIPLSDATPATIVRSIEGVVGVDLAPQQNHRLPAR